MPGISLIPCMLPHHKHYFFLCKSEIGKLDATLPAKTTLLVRGLSLETFFSLSFSCKPGKAMCYGKHAHVCSLNFTLRVSADRKL